MNEKKKMPILIQAKLFVLEGHSDDTVDWVQKATGIPSFSREQGGYKFKFTGELEERTDKSFYYQIGVTDNISFDRLEPKVITWTLIKENIEMALSFRDETGANAFWALVDEYLKKEAVEVQANSTTDMFLLEYKIPEPTKENLPIIFRQIEEIPVIQRRERINSIFIMKRDLLPSLRKLFNILQNESKLTNKNSLILFFQIMKLLINNAEIELLTQLLSDQYISFTLGCLQYDPPFIDCKLKHRKFLMQASRYIEVVPIKNKQKIKQIHFIQRLQYIKDSALNHHLDEAGMRMLSIIIFSNYRELLNSLFNAKDQDYLNQLFNLLRLQEIKAYRLLLEICRTARCLDLLYTGTKQIQKDLIFTMLAEKEIYEILVTNLKQSEPKQQPDSTSSNKPTKTGALKSRLRSAADLIQITNISLEIIINSLEAEPKYFKNYCISQKEKVLKYPLLSFLMRSLTSTNTVSYGKLVELLVCNQQNHDIAPLIQQIFLKEFLGSTKITCTLLRILQKLCDTLSEVFRDRLSESIQKLIDCIQSDAGTLRCNKQRQVLALQCLKKIINLYSPLQDSKIKIGEVLLLSKDKFLNFLETNRGHNNLPLSIFLQILLILRRAGGNQPLISSLRQEIERIKQGWTPNLLKYIDCVLNQVHYEAPQQLKRDRSSVNLGEQMFDGLPEKKMHL